MIQFNNFKSVNILNIFINNFKIKFKQNQNFLYINKSIKRKSIKKKIINKKFLYLIINFNQVSLINTFLIFLLLYKERDFEKNVIIFYKFEKEITANNIIPNQKKTNLNGFLNNTKIWTKDFLKLFIYFKKIDSILVRLK
tara:strand:+ start:93 stop:512 length:420 start_codon:yes stop_codon:yes gene_type:complete